MELEVGGYYIHGATRQEGVCQAIGERRIYPEVEATTEGTTEGDIMADRARKLLVWDELFHIAKVIGSTPGHGTSELDL